MKLTVKTIAAILITYAIITFQGCNNPPAKSVTVASDAGADAVNFNSILRCSNYTCQDGYFFTADYGCLYDPQQQNSFGNLAVYLIPLNKIDNSACDSVAQQITSLTAADIQQSFDAYVFLIPYADLHYNATGDPPYYQKENFTEKVYGFSRASQQWHLIDSIIINRDTENEKEQKWREDFLKAKVNKYK